jgi:transcriptional regulator with XRE-family HTH domain
MPDESRAKWARELGSRLREERERLNIGQGELARRLGYSKQLASFWEQGKSELSNFDLARLTKLGFDADYVLMGIRSGSAPVIPLPTGMVPYPDYRELLLIADGRMQASAVEREMPVFAKVAHGLAVDVVDQGLAPKLPPGSIVIVDREKSPTSGDVVVAALLATSEVLTRRFKPGRGKHFILYPDIALLPTRDITEAHQPAILGVMVEAVLRGSQ